MNNKLRKNKKGFTLTEMLVVVLIMAVLAAISMPMYRFAVERTRATQGILTLEQIAKAQNIYNAKRGKYANTMLPLSLDMPDTDGNVIKGSKFSDRYFDYEIFGDNYAAATAQRNTGEYEFSVDYATGEIFCLPVDNEICKKLKLGAGRSYESTQEEQESGEWVDCSSNVSALASLVGAVGMEAELEAELAYIPYCKMKSDRYKVCLDYYCEEMKIENDGCQLYSSCVVDESNECVVDKEYGSYCEVNLGNNVRLEKRCSDFDEENLECNEWRTENLTWWQDGSNYWECSGGNISEDGKSCTDYTRYRKSKMIKGNSYDFINCDTWNHGDSDTGVLIAECDVREYDDDGNQLMGGNCYDSKYSEVYDGAISGTFNANHTGCETYSHYWDYVNQIYCDNGTCQVNDLVNGGSYTCTANAQGTGCAS